MTINSVLLTRGSGLAPAVITLRAQLAEEGTGCTKDGTQQSCSSQLEALTQEPPVLGRVKPRSPQRVIREPCFLENIHKDRQPLV